MDEVIEADLVQAVRDLLTKEGSLGRFKAGLRTAVLSAISKGHDNGEKPKIAEETKLINELIREYMVWNGYLYSEQVLTTESGHNRERMERDVLSTKVGVADDIKTSKLPLIYYIVAAFINQD